MELDRINKLRRMAEDSLDSRELQPEAYVIAYALYSLVDATSVIESAIDDSTSIKENRRSFTSHGFREVE